MQTSSVCLRRQLPRRGSREKANCAERFYREESRERNERQPRRWKGQSGEKVGAAVEADLFSLLAQTASPKGKPGKGELRRQLSRRGKPGKGELRRGLLQRGKPRKKRKTAVALERAKRGKGWCGGWSRPLQSACADSFPEGEAGKGGIAQSSSTERKTEKGTKDSRSVGKGKAGKRLVRRLEQTSSVCLRRQLPQRGSRERGHCAELFYREENRERNERQP